MKKSTLIIYTVLALSLVPRALDAQGSSPATIRAAAKTAASTSACGNFQSKFFMNGPKIGTGNLCAPDSTANCTLNNPSDRTIWSTAEGWAHKDGERFFPVGLWMSAIRGINQAWGDTAVEDDNEDLIDEAAEVFDVFHQERRHLQPYMVPGTDHYHLSLGTHHAISRITRLGNCGLDRDDIYGDLEVNWERTRYDNKKNAVNFEEMMRWRRNIECAEDRAFYLNYFRDYVVPEVFCKTRVLDTPGIKNNDFIWYLADEPDQAWAKAIQTISTGAERQKGWSLHPDLLQLYQDAVKAEVPNALTFVSLGGNLRGHAYTYEHLYNTAHPPDSLHHEGIDLPTDTDLTMLDRTTPELEGDPLDYQSYRYAYDGTPLFEYFDTKDGQSYKGWSPTGGTHADTARFYDNIFHVAEGYCTTGDVLGLNAFAQFRTYPHWAGRTVDAIKDACGDDKPVWLHFDAGWNQSEHIHTANTYMLQVRSQVYASITHGATGVWFWGNDNNLADKITAGEIHDPPEASENQADVYWDTLNGLAQELQNLKPVLTGEILAQGVDDIHLHYTIRRAHPTADPYLIVVNTDLSDSGPATTNPRTFNDPLGLFPTQVMTKLQVVITDESLSTQWSGTISANTTWSGSIQLVGDLTVGPAATLTIDPGTLIRVDDTFELTVEGTLQVNGSPSASVVFSSAQTTNPTSGAWAGIRVEGTAHFNHAHIHDADHGILAASSDTVSLAHTQLNNCIIGLEVDNTDIDVTDSQFADNGLGLQAFGATTDINVDHTIFTGNTNGIKATNNANLNITRTTIDNTTITGVESIIYAAVDLDNAAVTGSGTRGLWAEMQGTIDYNYTNVYSTTGTHYVTTSVPPGVDATPLGANGNLSSPPHYFDATLILDNGSLMIDAGDPNAVTGSEPGSPARLDIGRHGATNDGSSPTQTNLQDGDFELGTTWWENAWSDRNTGQVTVWERRGGHDGTIGSYAYTTCDALTNQACDTNAGQIHQGALRSHRFKITVVNGNNHLKFLLAGYPGASCSAQDSYVRLVDAATDAPLLTNKYAPCADAFAEYSWDVNSLDGQWVYIEAVDGYNSADNAWIAVDNFHYDSVAAKRTVASDAGPLSYQLYPSYPNPFNPETTLRYEVPEAVHVRLEIYNLLGQPVRILVDQRQTAGHYQVIWDGRNQAGAPLASGVYLYRLIAGDYQQTHKLTLLK